MTEMQRQFEEWAAKEGHKMERAPKPWFYEWASTACAWRAWQASRAAIVVKLPEPKSSIESVFSMKVTKSLDDIGVYYE